MFSAFRQWWPLLLGVLAIQIANGLQSTAVGLRIDAAGFGALAIALVMSGLYAGQVASSMLSPRVIGRYSHVPAYVGLAMLAAAAPSVFLIAGDAVTWAIARFVVGFGLAGIYIVVESWLNDRVPNEMRGRVFAVYIQMQLLGLMAAQFLVPPVAGDMPLAIALVVGFSLLAILPVVVGKAPRPARLPFVKASFGALLRASPVGVVGATVSGFVWAVVMAMAPIYAQRTGFDPGGVAIFVASAVLGGLLLQFPLGWLSDLRDRRVVLAGMAGLAALVAIVGAVAGGSSQAAATAAIMAFGGLTFPFYSVAVSHVNDRIGAAERVPASGAMILLFGVGSIGGPFAASVAMDAAGAPGFFILLAGVTGALALYAAWRIVVARPSAP